MTSPRFVVSAIAWCKVKTKCCITETGWQFISILSAIHCNLNSISSKTACTEDLATPIVTRHVPRLFMVLARDTSGWENKVAWVRQSDLERFALIPCRQRHSFQAPGGHLILVKNT